MDMSLNDKHCKFISGRKSIFAITEKSSYILASFAFLASELVELSLTQVIGSKFEI